MYVETGDGSATQEESPRNSEAFEGNNQGLLRFVFSTTGQGQRERCKHREQDE
jgi:hypothetical protein